MANITALCGGVGGAKLALGLSKQTERLRLVVNTGDDFEHYGLKICPDLDTVAYTLSGLANASQGWGREAESFSVQEEMARLCEDVWFQLGDKDIALHLLRLRLLSGGCGLTAAMAEIGRRLKLGAELLPMTDATAATALKTDAGLLTFQDYFVRQRCAPRVEEVHYGGVRCLATRPVLESLSDPALDGIVICPSNPLLSIGPILAVPQIRYALQARKVPALAVSPLVAGQALKGPTAKVFEELGLEASALEVARQYRDCIDLFVLDRQDATLAPQIRDLGIEVLVTQTVMQTLDDKVALAGECVHALRSMSRRQG
jgi:LPPG:FO 2-phospho-L-lactate transferase